MKDKLYLYREATQKANIYVTQKRLIQRSTNVEEEGAGQIYSLLGVYMTNALVAFVEGRLFSSQSGLL